MIQAPDMHAVMIHDQLHVLNIWNISQIKDKNTTNKYLGELHCLVTLSRML